MIRAAWEKKQYAFFSVACIFAANFFVAGFAAEVRGVFFVASLTSVMAAASVLLLAPFSGVKKKEVHPTGESEKELLQVIEELKRGHEHQIDLMRSSVVKSKEEIHLLNLAMDQKLEEMRVAYLEFEDLRKEYHRLEEESQELSEESQKRLAHKEALIEEYRKTLAEQRAIIGKKQGYIAQLEKKVGDLVQEIRSLLQLGETVPGCGKPYDLSLQLQRYIAKVENITGIHHLGYRDGHSPRFLDLSMESYAVDKRRLFDSFRDENSGIVLIFSPQEQRFLFVNEQVKRVLGWSPEKFMNAFPELVSSGYSDWKKATESVEGTREQKAKVVIQSKTGKNQKFTCLLGSISKGPFADHVIGILSL